MEKSSQNENAGAKCFAAGVCDRYVMRRKLLRRLRRQKQELSLKDLEDIERRAGSAFSEMQEAWRFQHVIVNHDGEDSDNWDSFYYLIGDARKTVMAFAALLNGEEAPGVERWGEELVV